MNLIIANEGLSPGTGTKSVKMPRPPPTKSMLAGVSRCLGAKVEERKAVEGLYQKAMTSCQKIILVIVIAITWVGTGGANHDAFGYINDHRSVLSLKIIHHHPPVKAL